MEIHNNILPVVKENNLSNKKKSALNSLKGKTYEADSLEALASYGMAQVTSRSFKGNNERQKINVPEENRLNIINLLGITDKDEIKRLLNFTGVQFVLVSAFLYFGEDIDFAEKELDCKIENITEENTVELIKKMLEAPSDKRYYSDFCLNDNKKHLVNKDKLKLAMLFAQNLFGYDKNMAGYLISKSDKETSGFITDVIQSFGKILTDEEIQKFNTSLQRLGDTLKSITDEEFFNIRITQEYPKSEFIKDTYAIVKGLSPQERQKVYDYFGFELKYNEEGTKAGEYSIIGYPLNLNNGKKLAQITNADTKEVVERLREKVVKFSQNNKVICNNPALEDELNNIISVFPELRTQIEKVQHGAHEYDIMKHSLKVIQKILQNPEYEQLSEQDKHIMLISALFHDGNKAEGVRDKLHAEESAFDAYYIINKLNLPPEEKIKIYSMIKHHEWLGYVNDDVQYKLPVEKKQQSVAFDLQYDNLFDMAKIFTIADLKSVKKDDAFYLRYKKDFETHSKSIEHYINELKNPDLF